MVHDLSCPSNPSAETTGQPETKEDDILLRVQKPARYIGNELNAVSKDPSQQKLRIAFAFPDAYEVGMSHQGLRILYAVVNGQPGLYAERVFAPWPDMEELMRLHRQPLATLETGTALSRMDFVGFSLQYELCATTVLQMLDLGGIPLRAADRGPQDPFVVGGGPVAFNPMPLAPFFDAFAIGDGEELILDLAETQVRWKQEHGSRKELLEAWKRIPGVFVPSLHEPGEMVQRRILVDLDRSPFPSHPIVPFCEIVHDRVGIEIARGCTRGCRFCQAGILYRPVRERGADRILKLAADTLSSTGWDEVSLLSLSSGDHSQISQLVQRMTHEFAQDRVALSLPSLRTDTFSAEMAEHIRRVRKTGFTLAPEAGTDRLRRIINKGNTEQDLERAVATAFELGWRSVKLYFMIGLPFETDEDLDGIVAVLRRASRWSRGGKITGSISTFVPKSHTAFQWSDQISMTEIERRRNHIRTSLQRGPVRVKFHDPATSFLEGVLARGDHRLSQVIELAFRKGARLDAWDDQLKFQTWMEAFQEAAVDPEAYLAARDIEAELPWGFIYTGVQPEFLKEEWEKAKREELTPDCRSGACIGCGVCDGDELRPRTADTSDADRTTPADVQISPEDAVVRRFRLQYAKLGPMRFLGHQDLMRVFHRAFRRSEMKLDYSKGFHPHPKFRFSPPLALGVESRAEFVDFDVVDFHGDTDSVVQGLRDQLPQGLISELLTEIPLNEPSVSAKIQAFTYEIILSGSLSGKEVGRRVDEFLNAECFEITRTHKGRTRSRDLRQLAVEVNVSPSTLALTLKADQSGSVHPVDAFAGILGLSKEEARSLRIVKTSVKFQESSPESEGSRYVQ